MKKLLLILLVGGGLLLGQNRETLTLTEIINYFVRLSSEESENSYLYDYYEQLHENPININTADYETLSQLPVLVYYDINKLITYRKRHKKFKRKKELFNCGIISSKVEMILPFVDVKNESEHKTTNKFSFNTRSFAIRSFPNDENRDSYAGNLLKTNNRIKMNYGNRYYFSVLADKDKGEKSYSDFLSYNLAYKSNSIISKVVVGSYIIEFGQGLALWSPYAFSKSSDAVGGVIKYSHLLTQYNSSEETKPFLGTAAILKYGNFLLMPFYSTREVSVHIDSIGFYGFNSTGLFRTTTEISNKNNMHIKSEGVATGFKNKIFNIKILYFHNQFSLPFIDKYSETILGNTNNIFSTSIGIKYKRLLLKGESSISHGVAAHLYGIQFFITNRITFISLFRYYPHNYRALYSNGFGEKKNTNNEKGIYNGIRISTQLGKFNFYYDFNRTLFHTSTEPFPVKRYDYLIDYYSPTLQNIRFRIRYHRELKEHYLQRVELIAKTLTNIITDKGRISLYYKLGNKFRFKTELNISTYRDIEKKETGYSLSEEVRSSISNNLIIYGRVTLFDTPTFDSRIYLYENDIQGVFNMGMLYGKGISEYVLIKFSITKNVNVTAKYSEIKKTNYQYNPNIRSDNNTVRRIALELETKIGS